MIPIPDSFQRVTITPEIARGWLETRNRDNRKMSLVVAARYAEAMKEGRWRLTHQGIAFDSEGFLLDGQHRLKAVDLAGIPVDFNVIPDCDRDTFSVLDVGHKRQANHLIDNPNGTIIAAAARFVGAIDGSLTRNVQAKVYVAQADNDEVLAVIESWPELVEWAPAARAVWGAARLTPSPHLALLAQAARTQHADLIPEWVRGLTEGAGLARADARLHLRNRFGREASRMERSSSNRIDVYSLIVRAWNYYVTNRSVSVLKVHRKGEDVPAVLS
ncbi:hypothetical protein [Streptomyces sp.]|uniref:hypothetical protein n=1 Tax=Streptomyces sp. TaxID=1931 RepID=UPI002F9330C5